MSGLKLCECGCGQPTPIARKTYRDRGITRGDAQRFIRGHNPSPRPRTTGRPRPPRRRRPRPSPPPLTPTEAYAEQLLHASVLVVGAVHDEGPDRVRASIAAALHLTPPPGVDPVEALVTVLAAQIGPDTTAEQRLSWTRVLTRGADPAPTPRAPGASPHQAAASPPTPERGAA